jgi:hypothetical protein
LTRADILREAIYRQQSLVACHFNNCNLFCLIA